MTVPTDRSRQRAERRGRWAELIAALYLRLTFHAILARRVKSKVGEIDLVAKRGGTIIFIEVKQRQNADQIGNALEAVNVGRIRRAADYWLARHPAFTGHDIRFDVIFLAPGAWPRHVKGAF